VYKEISVEGEEDVSTHGLPADIGHPGRHSFKVSSFNVIGPPMPILSPSFSNLSSWHSETDSTYGIEFAHPEALSRVSTSESRALQPNFVSDQNVAIVARFLIARDVYPNANFVGGFFGIFVNPEIGNSESCSEFGNYFPRFRSSYRAGNVVYSTMKFGSGSAGSVDVYRYFHTFQNGLCYELEFDFVEPDMTNADLGCTAAVMREPDELNLIEPLLARVAFVRPTITVARESNPNAVPRVTRFQASPEITDPVANRREIKFWWSTQDADYVEFSYRCVPPPGGPGVTISESGGCCECANSYLPLNPSPSPNHSPNGSQRVLFGNDLQSEPMSIIVTLTPFSHAKAYPNSNKSITIQVLPEKQLPEGTPAANGKIVVTYSPQTGRKRKYQQGSLLTISWTEALSRSVCVELYLVQHNGTGGDSYRSLIGASCSGPSGGGSYKWTVSEKYSGSDYRILAKANYGVSSGFGPSFSIIRAKPKHN
jgi:hypothetical protein